MKIESIAYEEQYISLDDPSKIEATDFFLIKSFGKIVRNLNGETITYEKATKEDFVELEKEIVEFIGKANRTVYFVDNMKVSIVITFEDGTKQIVERGLAYEDEFFDSIVEDYLDEFAA